VADQGIADVETLSTQDHDIDHFNSIDWSEGYIQDKFGLPCRSCGCDLFVLLAGATDGTGCTRMMCSGECQPWVLREGERLVGYVDIREYREHGIPWVITAEEAERRGYEPKRPRPYRTPSEHKECSPEENLRWMEESRRRHTNWFDLKRRREAERLPPLDPVEWARMWNGEDGT
jgi:hypothetical protein